MTDASVKKLRKACRRELVMLWSDLDTARRNAIRPGTWTIQCENLEYRIVKLTKLVGPTPWEKIQITLLELGIYQRIHEKLGISVEVDMERVAEVRRSIDSNSRERMHD